jgi:hypothetical protein
MADVCRKEAYQPRSLLSGIFNKSSSTARRDPRQAPPAGCMLDLDLAWHCIH